MIKNTKKLRSVNNNYVQTLLLACKSIDKYFCSRQGLDYDYWSQEEKDLHTLVKQAIYEDVKIDKEEMSYDERNEGHPGHPYEYGDS